MKYYNLESLIRYFKGIVAILERELKDKENELKEKGLVEDVNQQSD